MCRKRQPAEVFVFGQQYPALSVSKIHQVGINRTRLEFADRENIMSLATEGPNHGKVTAFIRKESHCSALGRGRQNRFVRDRIGGVGKTRLDVVGRKARICVQ